MSRHMSRHTLQLMGEDGAGLVVEVGVGSGIWQGP